ncbi:MAG: protoporphyrinogen oxidase [Planctomycetia bacterium]|nr:protoporphyrinogen oxidase [Planctomycetia bacterium]
MFRGSTANRGAGRVPRGVPAIERLPPGGIHAFHVAGRRGPRVPEDRRRHAFLPGRIEPPAGSRLVERGLSQGGGRPLGGLLSRRPARDGRLVGHPGQCRRPIVGGRGVGVEDERRDGMAAAARRPREARPARRGWPRRGRTSPGGGRPGTRRLRRGHRRRTRRVPAAGRQARRHGTFADGEGGSVRPRAGGQETPRARRAGRGVDEGRGRDRREAAGRLERAAVGRRAAAAGGGLGPVGPVEGRSVRQLVAGHDRGLPRARTARQIQRDGRGAVSRQRDRHPAVLGRRSPAHVQSVGGARRAAREPRGPRRADPTADHAVLAADAVIVATPAATAARLLRPCDPALADSVSAIEYAGSAVVSLGFSREAVGHPLDAAGLVVPRRERRRLLAVSFSSQKFPGRAPPGTVLLRAFVGGALDPETTSLDDDRLLAVVLADLRTVLDVRGDPLVVQIDRWHHAMPQYTVGHVGRVATIGRLTAGHRGLALAGAAYEGVGIPQVIASGQAAAAAILRPDAPTEPAGPFVAR